MKITSENYLEKAMRTDCIYDESMKERLVNCSRLLHAAIGIATESGEFLDALKKHIFYGKSLDKVNTVEEAGDLLWYIGLALDDLSVTMNAVLTQNIEKLKLRYPGKFNGEDAINRDIKAERELLEDCKVFEGALQFTEPKQYSKRGMDFIRFAAQVLNHIENYTVPQYGDKGEDQASDWTPEMLLEQAKKYINRYGKNQRPGQEMLDFMKAAHYCQMAATKFEEK